MAIQPDKERKRPLKSFGARALIVFTCLLVLVAGLCIEALWRLALAALLWAPIVICAVAAMRWTVSLHLADPLAPLYAFFLGGLAARLVGVLCARGVRWRAMG